jgi:hypothetical protein
MGRRAASRLCGFSPQKKGRFKKTAGASRSIHPAVDEAAQEFHRWMNLSRDKWGNSPDLD